MRVTFSPVIRVEHQKLNQTSHYGVAWLSLWASTRPSADAVNWWVQCFLASMDRQHPNQSFLDELAANASRKILPVHPGSTDSDVIGYLSINRIYRRSSWTPETQANGAVRRRLVEFLVFNQTPKCVDGFRLRRYSVPTSTEWEGRKTDWSRKWGTGTERKTG